MVNNTNIVLIPKCDNLVSMHDWTPISLCNVIYKILSKVLANRLKHVFPYSISIEQLAFVLGRSILNEFSHYMKCKIKGKQGEMGLKIDINKAYDKVD